MSASENTAFWYSIFLWLRFTHFLKNRITLNQAKMPFRNDEKRIALILFWIPMQIRSLGREDAQDGLKARQSTPAFLPGKSCGQRSLAGYIIHKVAKSWTQPKRLSMHACRSAEPILPFLTRNAAFVIWS